MMLPPVFFFTFISTSAGVAGVARVVVADSVVGSFSMPSISSELGAELAGGVLSVGRCSMSMGEMISHCSLNI